MSAAKSGSGSGSNRRPDQHSGSRVGAPPQGGGRPSSSAGDRGARANGRSPVRSGGRGPNQPGGRGPGRGGGRGPSQPGRLPGRGPRRGPELSTIALGAVGVVVVAVVVIVAVVVTGGGKSSTTSTALPLRQPMPQSITDAVQSGWAPVANTVGVPPSSAVAAPTLAPPGAPLLKAPGSSKPAVAAVLAEFCPYCAAERWALVMALGQFGHFGHLNQTTSGATDVYPDTATFSFYPSPSYTSRYVDFSTTENTTNRIVNGSYQPLQTPPKWVAAVWQRYDNSSGYPFLDIGNRVLVKSPSYSPGVLAGLTVQQIAAKLKNPNDTVTKDIVGSANYLVASICSITHDQPSNVCSQPVVAKAAKAMGLK